MILYCVIRTVETEEIPVHVFVTQKDAYDKMHELNLEEPNKMMIYPIEA